MPKKDDGNKRVKTLNVPDGKDVKFVNKEIRNPFFPVSSVKQLWGDSWMDAYDLLTTLTASEGWMARKLKDNRDYNNNHSLIISADLTKNERKKLDAGYQGLKNKDVVIRVTNNHYLINPDFMSPNRYEEAKIKWLELIAKNNQAKD